MTSSDKETLSNTPTENDTVKIKFLFANRDGIHVEIECSPSDTIENITKTLQSKWPEEIDGDVPSLDRIRLICMGRGILGPANGSLEDNEVPVFLTHPTPVNVSVKPILVNHKKSYPKSGNGPTTAPAAPSGDCCCIIS
eukprot:scaffold1862_cov268-Chaetoceros_neogracile.AAC.32